MPMWWRGFCKRGDIYHPACKWISRFMILDDCRYAKSLCLLHYVVLSLTNCRSCVSGFANLFALTLIADQWSGIHCNTSCCISYTWWFVCRCACSKCLFAISQGRCISLFKQPPWSGSMGDLGLACCMLEHKAIQCDTYQFLFPVPTCLRCVSNTFEYISFRVKNKLISGCSSIHKLCRKLNNMLILGWFFADFWSLVNFRT